MFKKFSMYVLIMLLVVFAASNAFAEVTKIKLWQNLDQPDSPVIDNLIKKFHETHPNIEVEFELIPWAAAYNKYVTALVAGSPADVIQNAANWTSTFWDMGVLEPLDTYIENWDKKDDIFDSAWKYSRATPDAPIFGVPCYACTNVLYYRADMFEKLGLKIPETREEMLQVAKEITAKIDGAYGFGLRGSRGGLGMWLSFVLPAVDNKWFNDDGTSTFRNSAAVEANQWYIDLFKKWKVTPPTAPSDGFAEILNNFEAGVTGMMIHSIMSDKILTEVLGEEKIGVTQVPSVNGKRWTFLSCAQYVIPKASKHKKEAFEFISWMAEKEQQAYFDIEYGGVPIVKGLEETDPYFNENKVMKASIEAVKYAENWPCIKNMSEFYERVHSTLLQEALLGKISSQDMMDQIAELLEEK